MKILHRLKSTLSMAATAALAGAGLLAVQTASANPFASCITVATNSSSTNVSFYINESGGSCVVTYEDGSTNANFNGITTGLNVASGPETFAMNGHNGYTITCHKLGTGTPFQINSSSSLYYYWATPRGVDANKNPKVGAYFGRVYNGEASPGTAGNQALRGRGIYMLSPDISTNLDPGGGTNAMATGVFAGAQAAGSSSAPYRITVGPDNNVYVADYATADAGIYQFDAGFAQYTNVFINPIGEVQGYNAGTHGDPTGVFVTGSMAQSNLVVYTFDPDLPVSFNAALWYVDPFGNDVFHQGSEGSTAPGSFNNVYQYIIGTNAPANITTTNSIGLVLPVIWTNSPNKGVSLGLPSFQDSQIGDVTVEPNGYVVAEFNRANYSDGNIQIYNTNFNLIYTSLQPNGTDPFNVGGDYGYAGVRVSPDGQYLMTVDVDNQIEICYLTNGIPDISSLRIFSTAMGTTGNSRGCAFDAADNIIQNSSGEAVLSEYSLGYTSTCVTSNDITGTNGTFSFALPPVSASLAITQPTASQNYTNIVAGNAPIPGVFTITLNTNFLSTAATINYSITGNGTNGVNFIVNDGFDANGVYITNSYVTFPTGTYPGGGNWQVTITVTPTASPVSGPTFNESVAIVGGTTYIPAEPFNGNLAIINTGPQMLILSAATAGTNMYRGTTNDYAEFIITRYGDVSVGGYTVTNFGLGGTAVFGKDYTAGPQNYSPSYPPSTTPPSDGLPGIVVNSGVSTFTNLVGNPVSRANLYEPRTNVSIVIGLTNAVTGINNTSQEGVAYTVSTASVTLMELDNASGGEVVLWSDPLTNAVSDTNWTVTFASTKLATNTVLPVVIPNYTNLQTSVYQSGGTNDFLVQFGNPVVNDGIPQSPLMVANGWNTALKTSVENNYANVAGVNVMPQGVIFHGNYALRFSMYLSLYDRAANNPFYSGIVDRQFALFGIDVKGTNCDYRPTFTVSPGTGSGQGSGATNWDGLWFATDAGLDSQTPDDFDGFASPVLPNAGGSDVVSAETESEQGIFKDPPFEASISRLKTFGGQPAGEWVDVSVETTLKTNIAVYINQSKVMSSFASTNGGVPITTGVVNPGYTNGTVMLGYENPLAEVSDGSGFAYFSNVRVIELTPFLLANPVSGLIMTNGQSATLSATATYASAPLTNTWFAGVSSPLSPVLTNSANATNFTSVLSLSGIAFGTNYTPVFSDAAGSVTGLVAVVEVIQGPTNVTATAGSPVAFAVTPTGQSAPTAYQWRLNGVALSGATSATLTISSASAANAGVYSVAVTNAYGSVIPSATLTVGQPPLPVISGVSLSGTNVVIGFSSTDPNGAAKSFVLLSSPNVAGPYTTNTTAVVTGSAGSYSIQVPESTNLSMFFKVEDNN